MIHFYAFSILKHSFLGLKRCFLEVEKTSKDNKKATREGWLFLISLSDVLLLVLLHPQVQLVDGWDKDEQRETYGHQGARLGAEDVCDAHLGILVDACQ